jgi:hypothetical protein
MDQVFIGILYLVTNPCIHIFVVVVEHVLKKITGVIEDNMNGNRTGCNNIGIVVVVNMVKPIVEI